MGSQDNKMRLTSTGVRLWISSSHRKRTGCRMQDRTMQRRPLCGVQSAVACALLHTASDREDDTRLQHRSHASLTPHLLYVNADLTQPSILTIT